MSRIAFIPPADPVIGKLLPEGPDWEFQVKADGWRCQVNTTGPRVRFFTSTGGQLTDRLPSSARELAPIAARNVVIDAELVAADHATGSIDFYGLPAIKWHPERLALIAFDLMHLDGKDIRHLPLGTRVAMLEELVEGAGIAPLQMVLRHAHGPKLFIKCKKLGFEGVVAGASTALTVPAPREAGSR